MEWYSQLGATETKRSSIEKKRFYIRDIQFSEAINDVRQGKSKLDTLWHRKKLYDTKMVESGTRSE